VIAFLDQDQITRLSLKIKFLRSRFAANLTMVLGM